MRRSVLVKDIMPFIFWFSTLFVAVISIDLLLHRLQLVWVGKYLGIPGVLILMSSFLYSLRKRKILKTGSLKTLLLIHFYLAWFGSVLIMVHAGIHFNALLPWSAFILMLIVVISGLVGKYLLKNARQTLRTKYAALLKDGYSEQEVEKKVFFDALTVKAMTRWRQVHKPITLLFIMLSTLHIITIFMFWSWFK